MALETGIEDKINSLPNEVARIVKNIFLHVQLIETEVQNTIDFGDGVAVESRKIAQDFIGSEIRPLIRQLDFASVNLTTEQKETVNSLKKKIADAVQAKLAKYPDLSAVTSSTTLPTSPPEVEGTISPQEQSEFNDATREIVDLLNNIETIKPNQPGLRTAYLTQLRTTLLDKRSVLTSTTFRMRFGSKFSSEIENLSQRITNATQKIDGVYSDTEIKELGEIPFMELAKYAIEQKVDPFLFSALRDPSTDKRKLAIATVVQNRLFGTRREGESSATNREREVAFVWLQMKLIADKLQYQGQKASSKKWTPASMENGTQGFALESALEAHLVSREDWMRVTSHDQVWGNDFKQLIDAVIIQVALKSVQPNMDKNLLPDSTSVSSRLIREHKEREVVMTKEGQIVLIDGRIYKYNPAISYEAMIDDKQGRTSLQKFLETFQVVDIKQSVGGRPVTRKAHDMAIEFAQLAYLDLTLLDDSYLELQKSTKTAGHNEGETSMGYIFDPTATSVHTVERYAKPGNWLQMFNAYFDMRTLPDHYFLSDPKKEEYLYRVRQFKLHQQVYFDTPFFDILKHPRFLETIFPSPKALIGLQETELLWVASATHGDREVLVDRNNNILVQKTDGGKVLSADGTTELGMISGSMASISSTSSGGLMPSQELGIMFTDRNGKTVNWSEARITQLINGTNQEVNLGVLPNNVGLYWTALRGMKQALEITFAALPANLTKEQILTEISPGKGGALNELFSAWGMAKMFKYARLSELLKPILGHYVYRLIGAFPSAIPEERVELIKEMIDQLGSAGTYGGLGGSELSLQVTAIIDSLTLPRGKQEVRAYSNVPIPQWGDGGRTVGRKIVDLSNAARPPSQYRDQQLVAYLTDYWEHEKTKLEMPPIAYSLDRGIRQRAWRKKKNLLWQTITPDQEHLMLMADWKYPIFKPIINRTIELFKNEAKTN